MTTNPQSFQYLSHRVCMRVCVFVQPTVQRIRPEHAHTLEQYSWESTESTSSPVFYLNDDLFLLIQSVVVSLSNPLFYFNSADDVVSVVSSLLIIDDVCPRSVRETERTLMGAPCLNPASQAGWCSAVRVLVRLCRLGVGAGTAHLRSIWNSYIRVSCKQSLRASFNVCLGAEQRVCIVFITAASLIAWLPSCELRQQLCLSDSVCLSVCLSVTVKHILIDCTCFTAARQRYLGVDTLKELSENVKSRNVVAFIKDTNFYRWIQRCFYITLIALSYQVLLFF